MLVIALAWSLNRDCKVEPITKCETDTIFITKVDTIVEYKTRYIQKRTVDTLYMETMGDSLISLPVVQKHYNKESVYDLWVSGVEPLSLDSAKVYTKTEYQTVTNTITNTIEDNKPHLYVSGGFNAFSGTLRPNVNISLSANKKWLYGLEIGLDKDYNTYYGVKVGCKIK